MSAADPLAAVNAMIEALGDDLPEDFGHLWTPEKGQVSTANLLANKAFRHFGQFGHPETESMGSDPGVHHGADQSTAAGAGVARESISTTVQSVHTVQSLGTQGSISGQSESAGVHRCPKTASPAGGDPEGDGRDAWQAWLSARTARHRRAERNEDRAACRAFGDAVDAWHRRHGAAPVIGRCSGCGKPVGLERFQLADGAVVHWHAAAKLDCITAYGRKWRAAAENGLLKLGITAPHGWSG